MCAHDHHCPFLNKADTRCSDNFQLNNLEHAFEYCFDRYQACPVYLERLVERRVRRIEAKMTKPQAGDSEVPYRPALHGNKSANVDPGRVFVQVAVRARGLARERAAA